MNNWLRIWKARREIRKERENRKSPLTETQLRSAMIGKFKAPSKTNGERIERPNGQGE